MLELGGYDRVKTCTRISAEHTNHEITLHQQNTAIALNHAKNKHSPWSLAAELTLKQAPKTKVPLYMTKNERLRAKMDSVAEAISLSPIHSTTTHSDVQAADAYIACMPPSLEVGQAYSR